MDNFISEIANIVKLPFNEIIHDFKIIMLADKSIYVGNYKKILDYSSEKIVLKVYKDFLEITGQNLILSQINKNEIVVKGKVVGLSLGGKSEK